MTLLAEEIGSDFDQEIRGVFIHRAIPEGFISDGEIMRIAPNIIEFATGQDWLDNPTTFKHTRQYQILRDFYQIRCPICNPLDPDSIDCWGKGQEYLESEVLLTWNTKYRDDVCPKCCFTKQDFLQDGLFQPHDVLIGCAGMRSGKSVTAGIMGDYFEHRVLTWWEPIQQTLEILDTQPLQISFVASTEVQSKETIWSAYKALRDKSPWFKKYARWIKQKEQEQIIEVGRKPWRYEDGTSKIEHGLQKIVINSLNSNSSGMAGRTRLWAFIDELSRFDTTESKQSATEVYRVLSNSLRTVRSIKDTNRLPHWLGSMISISSPISVEDKTMQLLKVAPRLEKMFSFHYATWDFNPYQPREHFDEEYEVDPVAAERDFGANPPLAENPLIDDMERFEKALDPTLKPTVEFRDTMPRDELGREYIGKEVVWAHLDTLNVHYLFFDAGSSYDSFAGASMHGEWVDVRDEITGGITRTMIGVLDWVMSIRPTIKPRRTVFFECIVKMVDMMKRRQLIGGVGFDRWNSEGLIQAIRNLQIPADYRPMKYADFQSLVSQAYQGRVKLLPHVDDDSPDPKYMSDQNKAIYELSKLRKSLDLKKVYNPDKGKVQGYNSDDLAYVVTGAHTLLKESLIVKTNQKSVRERLKREMSAQPAERWIGQQSVIIPGAGITQVGPVPPEDAYAIGPEAPGRIGAKLGIGAVTKFTRW